MSRERDFVPWIQAMGWEEGGLYRAAVKSMFVMAALTVLPAKTIIAPYGRHWRGGWGPSLHPKLSWFLMESPSLALPFLVLPLGHNFNPTTLIIMLPFVIHYFQRTLVYPLRLPSGSRPVPIAISSMAFFFNLYNAYLQVRWVSHFGSYPASWIVDIRFIVGVMIFSVGMAINIWADSVLSSLRKDATGNSEGKESQRYKIPRGGLYEYVSCPNYLGEIIEWLGWAILTWSQAGLAFFAFTASNLVPRALTHHDWYHKQFGTSYPKSKKALIPFVL